MLALLQETETVRSAAEGRVALWGDYALADPWFLAIVPLAILFTLWGRGRRGREPGRVPTVPGELQARTLAQRLAWIPPLLQACALMGVCVALARPLRGSVETTSVSEGVDIALVIDRSSSMQYRDLDPEKTRLEVVKEVVGEFAARRMTDSENASDYCCLVTFSRYPELLCPFTLDVDQLSGFLAQVELVANRAEDGTGIGIALAKAVAVLRETDAKSKVVVLLTDGKNNLDEIAPLEAAELAAEEGIRVYTVFAGLYDFRPGFFGEAVRTTNEIDTAELEKIAEVTDGRFFRASDREGLEAAYAMIEELARTPRQEREFSETFDLYPRFVLLSLIAYALAWLLGSTWLRRLP